MKGVNIFLADGFEDVEALAVRDVLVRGGVQVNLAGIDDDPVVTSSHGVTVVVDLNPDELDMSAEGTCADDVMIFPGGMPGSRNLASCAPLISAMKAHYAAGGTVAAICAAPGLVLGQLGSGLKGVEFTCFDGFEEVPVSEGAVFVKKAAVSCGRVITGRSAGYAVDFGLEILRKIRGEEAAAAVNAAMNLPVD